MELVCLGVGAGKTMVYQGEPSSAFVVRTPSTHRGLLLIDCGFGVVREALRACPEGLPRQVYLSHNHSDHAAELPVLLAVERLEQRGRRLVVAERNVAQVLQERRLFETSPEQKAYDADWTLCDEGRIQPLEEGLAIKVLRARHSELCFGFVLYVQEGVPADQANDTMASGEPPAKRQRRRQEGTLGEHEAKGDDASTVSGAASAMPRWTPILGFSADSGWHQPLLDALAEDAPPLLLVDARRAGTAEHLSFEEVATWAKEKKLQERGCLLRVYHYGLASQRPLAAVDGVEGISRGEVLALEPRGLAAEA